MKNAKSYLLDSAPVKSLVDMSQKAKKLAEEIPPKVEDFLENDKVQSVIEFGKIAVDVALVVTNPCSILQVGPTFTPFRNGINPLLPVIWKPKL